MWVAPDDRDFQMRTEVKERASFHHTVSPVPHTRVKVGPQLTCTCFKPWQIDRNEAERKEELSGKAGVNRDHKPLAVWCCLSQPCSASLADNTAHHTPGHCSDTER